MKGQKHLKLGNLVLVEWNDAWAHNEGWSQWDKQDLGYARCCTVGMVIRLDEEQVTLAATWGQHTGHETVEYNTLWGLPLGMITQVRLMGVM